MAKTKRDGEYWAEYEAERRELEELFARMRERHRLEDEREERLRQRLHSLTFGQLGRQADTA